MVSKEREHDHQHRRRRPKAEPKQREQHFPEYRHQDFSAPRIPKRDYEPDPVTGKPIDYIFTAFSGRDGRGPLNFDTVFEQIKNSEDLGPEEFVCYIGQGNFAVYREIQVSGKKVLELKKKIPYEDTHEKPLWRKELSPGISRDYKPEPLSLGELYSDEELAHFPRMGSGSGIYLPRNS